jgi:hypothetical protein
MSEDFRSLRAVADFLVGPDDWGREIVERLLDPYAFDLSQVEDVEVVRRDPEMGAAEIAEAIEDAADCLARLREKVGEIVEPFADHRIFSMSALDGVVAEYAARYGHACSWSQDEQCWRVTDERRGERLTIWFDDADPRFLGWVVECHEIGPMGRCYGSDPVEDLDDIRARLAPEEAS